MSRIAADAGNSKPRAHREGRHWTAAALIVVGWFGISGDLLVDSGRSALSSQLIAFANTLASHMSERVGQHITLGLGAYASFAASPALAARDLVRSRAPASDFAAE
jgi:hypothetical protein